MIKLGDYKEISDAQYNAKIAKDNLEYAKINKFLITRKVDNYNTQAYGEDFYKVYRIAEKLIRANKLDFINWRIVIDTKSDFNAYSNATPAFITPMQFMVLTIASVSVLKTVPSR